MPYDVLQWEINRFLEPNDRASLNATMEWQERVYNRFPKGFAKKFAVKVAMNTQKSHVKRINYMVDNEDDLGAGCVRMAIQWIGLYADFLVKPMALPLFKYSKTGETKAKALSDLATMIDEDFVFSAFMTDEVRGKIRNAMSVLDAIVPEARN
jgi:hypothetical protein